ncbi:MAG: D-aminoacyl-tRNA deacylase [Phycisphaerales bacterium]|nr:D-aminoacyl-tRNA deacylase [Phycisphaerales bacterium]
MIAVAQRVSQAWVDAEGAAARQQIGRGLLVLVAIEPRDTPESIDWMARKLTNLRVFPDDDGRMNRSTLDISGEILLVSQFTLAGTCDKGNRPSFVAAAPPSQAAPACDALADAITERGVPTRTGVFGASMQVGLVNDGPVTLIIETPS